MTADELFSNRHFQKGYELIEGEARQNVTSRKPDLVVEVASPSEYHPEMDAKVPFGLDVGIQFVWAAWPETHVVDMGDQDSQCFHPPTQKCWMDMLSCLASPIL
jgi:Uma2 family endonuclease